MASPKPLLPSVPDDLRADPVPAPPATSLLPRLTSAAALVITTVLFGFAVRASRDSAQVAYYVFAYLSLLFLDIAMRLTNLFPPGSPAAARAWRAVGLFGACTLVAMTWNMPTRHAVSVWVLCAAILCGLSYISTCCVRREMAGAARGHSRA